MEYVRNFFATLRSLFCCVLSLPHVLFNFSRSVPRFSPRFVHERDACGIARWSDAKKTRWWIVEIERKGEERLFVYQLLSRLVRLGYRSLLYSSSIVITTGLVARKYSPESKCDFASTLRIPSNVKSKWRISKYNIVQTKVSWIAHSAVFFHVETRIKIHLRII